MEGIKSNQFEALIKEKSDIELINIIANPGTLLPEFVEKAKQELKNIRNISATTYREYVKDKSDDELICFYVSNGYPHAFIQIVETELTERNVPLDTYKAEKAWIEKQLDSPTRETIHGWLAWFLFAIGIGTIVSLSDVGKTFSISDFDLQSEQWVTPFGIGCTIISITAQIALAIYTIILFLNYKPNAVANGKAYIVVCFVGNLLIILTNRYETDSYVNNAPQVIRSTIWTIIWFVYLLKSEQVNAIFPKGERKILLFDKCLWAAIIVPILLWFILAISVGISKGVTVAQSPIIEETSLDFFEYTDKRIAFKCPISYKVEKRDIENDVCYILTSEIDNIVESSITIYSTFDNTDTQTYFKQCIEGWQDKSLTDTEYKYSVLYDNHRESNGNSLYQQKSFYKSYDSSNFDIYWTFTIVFNKKTIKCCVISCYSISNDTSIDEIINSLRFK
jgi:hypothetical protein